MTFEYSDALLLQSIKFSEQVDQGATLTDIVQASDYIDHSIMTYNELINGTKKLKQIGLVVEHNKRLQTTKTFKDWWTKKYKDKKRIVIIKALEEVKAYLDKTYATTENEVTAKTEFVKVDLDNAIEDYQKLTSDILEKFTTKKK